MRVDRCASAAGWSLSNHHRPVAMRSGRAATRAINASRSKIMTAFAAYPEPLHQSGLLLCCAASSAVHVRRYEPLLPPASRYASRRPRRRCRPARASLRGAGRSAPPNRVSILPALDAMSPVPRSGSHHFQEAHQSGSRRAQDSAGAGQGGSSGQPSPMADGPRGCLAFTNSGRSSTECGHRQRCDE